MSAFLLEKGGVIPAALIMMLLQQADPENESGRAGEPLAALSTTRASE
jgi:hypothetical protein